MSSSEEKLAEFDRQVQDLQATEAIYQQIQQTFPAHGASIAQRATMAEKVLTVLNLLLDSEVSAKRDFRLTRQQIQEVQQALDSGVEAGRMLEKVIKDGSFQPASQAVESQAQRQPHSSPGSDEFAHPERKGGPIPSYHHDERQSFPMFADSFKLYREFCYIPQNRACLLLKMALKDKAMMLAAHIDPRTYQDQVNPLKKMLKDLTEIFLPATESGLMSARFHSSVQGQQSIAQFHGKLRYLYSCAFPHMTTPEIEASTQLIHHFRNNLNDLNIQKQVIRANPQTYQEALVAAQKEESTNLIVAINANPALKQALGAGASSTQLTAQATGALPGQVFQPPAAHPPTPPVTPGQLGWSSQPPAQPAQPTPMEIGSLDHHHISAAQAPDAKCFYCPDKPANHPIERCWRIRTAIRQHFGADHLPEALGKAAGPGGSRDPGRGRGWSRGTHFRPRGTGLGGRGARGGRQQWRQVRNQIAALQLDLDNLALDEIEQGEEEEQQGEQGDPSWLAQPDEEYQ